MKENDLRKATLALTILTVAQKAIGYLRELFLANYFGASGVIDAYQMAVSIPEILFGWLMISSVAYVPVYMEAKLEGPKEAERFSNQVFSWLFLLGLISGIATSVLSPYIVKFVAPGFADEAYTTTVSYLRIITFVSVFWPCANALTEHLKCEKYFVRSALPAVAFGLTQILGIYLCSKAGAAYLAYIPVASYCAFFAFLMINAFRSGYRFRLALKVSPHLKKMLSVMLPLFFLDCIKDVNVFVDKLFASWLSEGSISIITYSSNLNSMFYAIFSIGIFSVIYPLLSEMATKADIGRMTWFITRGINFFIVLFIPLSVGIAFMGKPLIALLYERGEFTADSTEFMYEVFVVYGAGLLFMALRELMNYFFCSIQKTKKIVWVGIVTLVVNCVCDFLLVNRYGAVGLAAATSISIAVTIPFLGIQMRKELFGFPVRRCAVLILKALGSSAVMSVFLWFINQATSQLMTSGRPLQAFLFAGMVLAGAAVYFLLMRLMRVEEVTLVLALIRNFLAKSTKKSEMGL